MEKFINYLHHMDPFAVQVALGVSVIMFIIMGVLHEHLDEAKDNPFLTRTGQATVRMFKVVTVILIFLSAVVWFFCLFFLTVIHK